MQKTLMNITGTNFGNDPTQITAFLGNSNEYHVYDLSILSMSDTLLTVILPGGTSGNFTVHVVLQSVGEAQPSAPSTVAFQYLIQVTGISPNIGSIYGGTVLTITGLDFSSILNQNQAYIGVDLIELTPCFLLSATTTELVCVTETAPNDQFDQPVAVVVTQRVSELATCTGDCSFTYSTAHSPNVSNQTSLAVNVGDTLVLTADNFMANSPVQITLAYYDDQGNPQSYSLNATSIDDQTISFIMPNLPTQNGLGIYNPTVYVPGIGNAFTGQLQFTTQASFIALNPTTAGLGPTLMTFTGTGFPPAPLI